MDTNKTYAKKRKIRNRIILQTLLFLTIISFYIPLPYYIYTPGGLVDITNRATINDNKKSSGGFYMSYVTEYKATIPVLLFSKFRNDWDVVKKEEVLIEHETEKENEIRNELLLEEANNYAVMYAFLKAGKEIKIYQTGFYITYVDSKYNPDLKVGDEILEFDGVKITSKEQLYKVISESKVSTPIKIKIRRNKKETEKTVSTYLIDKESKLGIMITVKYDLKTNPSVKFNFKNSESGPSGGFMMSLSLYNHLQDRDLTKGRKIAGTGTLSENGAVGEISGIKYKLLGAEKEHADIFFVPSGDNYKEAKKVVNKYKMKLKLVEVKKLEDAIDYLEKM